MTDEATAVAETTPSVATSPGDGGGAPSAAPASAPPAASPAVVDAPVSEDSAATAIADAAAPKKDTAASLLGEGKAGEPATEADASAPVVEEAAGEAPPAQEYKEFVLPEGITVTDPEKLGKFTGILGEHGVPQERAQELVDMHVAAVKAATESIESKFKAELKEAESRFETAKRENFDRKVNDGLAAAKTTFGNRFDATVQTAVSVLDNYGKQYAQPFRQALNEAGLGTNPAVVGFLYNIGVALGEGSAVPAATPAPSAPVSRASKRYVG